jgi:thiamine-phosphate pyrophosphorylase
MIILLSKPISFKNESDYINHLFDEGLEIFHLRKPKSSQQEVIELLNSIKREHLGKIVIHSHYDLLSQFPLRGMHLSREAEKYGLARNYRHLVISKTIHELESLNTTEANFEYLFISPLFDSISKPYYKATFTTNDLRKTISEFRQKNQKTKLIALGGINIDNINSAKEIGFHGVAMLGYFWNNFSFNKKDLSKKFKTVSEICQNSNVSV